MLGNLSLFLVLLRRTLDRHFLFLLRSRIQVDLLLDQPHCLKGSDECDDDELYEDDDALAILKRRRGH